MAIGEWRVAMASALTGLAAGACDLARAYSLERGAFGAPIATYQAISHTLVELHMAVEAARNLTWRAAWYHAHEPGTRPELPAMALSNAIRTATDVTARSVHIHGGFGVTLEADVSLYHRRAGVWGRVAGGQRLLERAAETALDRIVASRRAASASGARLNGPSAALRRPAIPVEPA
jgi:alkylation response protein AidB-like acyl-CoA dehydrogenase